MCQQIPQCSAAVSKPKNSCILKNNVKNRNPNKKKEVTCCIFQYNNNKNYQWTLLKIQK